MAHNYWFWVGDMQYGDVQYISLKAPGRTRTIDKAGLSVWMQLQQIVRLWNNSTLALISASWLASTCNMQHARLGALQLI